MNQPDMTQQEQFQALNVLEYVFELFESSPRESFTREDVLRILNQIKSDSDLFEPIVMQAHAQVLTEIAAAAALQSN